MDFDTTIKLAIHGMVARTTRTPTTFEIAETLKVPAEDAEALVRLTGRVQPRMLPFAPP